MCKKFFTISIDMRLDLSIRILISLSIALTFLGCSNEIDPYLEEHRPQFHFSPQGHWMNDPNGLVYYDGEYHLFYQYYPDSTVWGPMHWGHAISTDLIHWEHLPIALYPDELGYIFSGSAVIDWNNTSGLASDQYVHPPMIAIFTHHDPDGPKNERDDFQVQSIAYSLDKGRTWEKYTDNPVIPNSDIRDFRDPKVIWDEERSQWVLVLAAGDRIMFYTSQNLIDWNLVSEFGQGHGSQGRPWECPDLFPLSIDDSSVTKWVLIVSQGQEALNGGSGTQYFVGDWDGKNFTNLNDSTTVLWLDHGKDNYAGVTWSDVHKDDNRRLFIGWMSNWQYAQQVPTVSWRSAMTLPRELSLKTFEDHVRLISNPVREARSLRLSTTDLKTGILSTNTHLIDKNNQNNGLFEIEMRMDLNGDSGVELLLANSKGERVQFGYDVASGRYYIDRTFAGKSDFSKDYAGVHYSSSENNDVQVIDFKVYVDHSSIEIFAEQGRVAMTEIFFPTENFDQLSISSPQGQVELLEGRIHYLDRIW